jgi:hypothetical protein
MEKRFQEPVAAYHVEGRLFPGHRQAYPLVVFVGDQSGPCGRQSLDHLAGGPGFDAEFLSQTGRLGPPLGLLELVDRLQIVFNRIGLHFSSQAWGHSFEPTSLPNRIYPSSHHPSPIAYPLFPDL